MTHEQAAYRHHPLDAEAPTGQPQAELRDRIAEALREHYLCTNRDEADADGNLPCRCGDWREPGAEADDENDWDSHLADAALAVLPPTAPCSCRTNPTLTAQIGYPVRCPHCPPDAGPVPPTHWTKHVQCHHPEAARVLPPAADRAAASAALWAAAEHHTVAEWICCDPIDPAHALCVQGGAALRMLKALLVDDPEAWKPAPLLDEVMQFVAPAGSTAEAHRLALSFALGLGTGAPWDAIHDRATELGLPPLAEDPVAQRLGLVPAPAGRAAVLREEAALIRAHCPDHLDSNSAEGSWINCHCDVADDMERRADETQQLEPTTVAASEPRANETGGTVAEAQQQPATETDEVALLRLTLDAVEEGRRELRSDIARLRSQLWTLAAVFEGFGRLLATSSRDWGQYAPDAWLYAVICGWDCEEAVHDETCTHGAMEEMQQRHGWDDKTVAKARRYRAVVHTLTAPAAVEGAAAADTGEETQS